ncbi:dienelactone hydrolase family protein [Kitasatospora sp. NPDC059646]|uniref:dienelactone hydrolase family protein n=1 Tax=Kitasatospora sp. NPDC059646 TaxID=3346893 RepID=UPI00369CFCAD
MTGKTLSTELRIPTTDGGSADAFAVHPDGDGQYPGVLMYPDAFGIRPVVREMARELAEHGYYVLVPNPFHRHGPTPVVELPAFIDESRADLFARLMPLIRAHTAELSRSDAADYLDFLTARPEVGPGPVAVTGYCFGGLLAMRTAAARPHQVAAVAAFHAPVAADGPELFAEVAARLHLGHAATDLTPDTLADLNRALDAAGLDHTSEIYPGTVHGFTMSDTSAFSATGLRLHWDRLLPLLAETLPAA